MTKVFDSTKSPSIPRATHSSGDTPLIIGDAEFQCFVLEDGSRLLSRRSALAAIGRSPTLKRKEIDQSTSESIDDQLPTFPIPFNVKSFISGSISLATKSVIFRTKNGVIAHGYRAELLPKICSAYIKARRAGALRSYQLHIAERAETILFALAEVGIIALVDEATGYQKSRPKDALAEILEKFIAAELQPYLKKFPPEFYRQIFRLRGMKYDPRSVKRPVFFGAITRDIVYRRLAPGIWDELKVRVRRNEDGRPAEHMHRHLTGDMGDPRLLNHIEKVIMLMQVSHSWDDFMLKLNTIMPPYDDLGVRMQIDLESEGQIRGQCLLGLEEQPLF